MAGPGPAIQRNDPCPCGSGRKYKKCCLPAGASPAAAASGASVEDAGELELRLRLALEHHSALRLEAARSEYERILAVHPREARALCGLGLVRCDTGDPEGGLELLRRSVASDPSDTSNRLQLALRLQVLGRNAEALTEANRVLAADRHNPRALRIAGYCYEISNRLDEAEATLDALLAREPGDPDATVVRARVWRRRGELEPARLALERLLRATVPVDRRALALYELGRVHDRAGRYAEALEAFTRGAQEKARSAECLRVKRIDWPAKLGERLRLPGELLAPRFAPSVQRPRPAFLAGFVRSGTTLLERALDEHSSIVTSDELPILMEVIAHHEAGLPAGQPLEDRLRALDLPAVERLRQRYRHEFRAALPELDSADVLLDKGPLNLVELPWIAALFPEARLVVALRDPRDTCLSAFMQDFRLHPATVETLHLAGTVEYYAQVMGFWLELRDRLALPWLEVRYEDLVERPEATLRGVLEFLGLPWHDAVADLRTRGSRRVFASSSYATVSEPLFRSSLGRWRNYERALEKHAARLAPFVERFGYAP